MTAAEIAAGGFDRLCRDCNHVSDVHGIDSPDLDPCSCCVPAGAA